VVAAEQPLRKVQGGGRLRPLLGSVLGLYEGDVVPLDHDAPQRLPRVSLQVDFIGLVQHQVHVLVKPFTKRSEYRVASSSLRKLVNLQCSFFLESLHVVPDP